jgi:NAD(P)-dependent dehydrogenase (short-subunit alcohol dehydrogenase family)
MSHSILITGATRGLGQHLARQFAGRGYRLALTGRDAGGLDELADALAGQADQVVTRVLDVVDPAAIPAAIQDCADTLGGLDIVVANAGIAIAARGGQGQLDAMRQVIDVNLNGAIATCEAAVELFQRQGQGQLVGITSVAAMRGLPRQAAYCASKAGFSRYLQALRVENRGKGIAVTELAPGFIDTEMNRDMPSRPFVIDADKGTRIMADLIERKVKFSFVPRWPWSLLGRALPLLPDSVIARM